jgi:Mn2+/Fe2+ NRAMP family transporter
MELSNGVALFIMLTTAVTPNARGFTDTQTSAQVAEALRPIAARFAFTIFALGIIGTGLLALPVLTGSAAYAVEAALHWQVGLAQLLVRARAFYGTIAVATCIGAALNFTALDRQGKARHRSAPRQRQRALGPPSWRCIRLRSNGRCAHSCAL